MAAIRIFCRNSYYGKNKNAIENNVKKNDKMTIHEKKIIEK